VPSAELSARIQRWIDEIDLTWPDSLQNWPHWFFKEKNALLLAGNQAFLWALTPSGEVLCLDMDRASRAAPETDPRYLYAVLASASERAYPELRQLVPDKPPGVRRCPDCGGNGTVPGEAGICFCGGLGWLI